LQGHVLTRRVNPLVLCIWPCNKYFLQSKIRTNRYCSSYQGGGGTSPCKKRWRTVLKENFHGVNGKAQHALMNSPAFFFLRHGGRGKWIFKIFSLLPMCSHHVPNSTSILSHMVCPKFNSHVYKLKRWNLKEHMNFYFAAGVQRGDSIGACPMFEFFYS